MLTQKWNLIESSHIVTSGEPMDHTQNDEILNASLFFFFLMNHVDHFAQILDSNHQPETYGPDTALCFQNPSARAITSV